MPLFKSKSGKEKPWLFVGLGNPDPEHEGNRHNIGFMAVDEIVRRHSFSPWKKKFKGLIAEGEIGGEKVFALKPMTYMNISGVSVTAAAAFYKVPKTRIFVFHDELDLVPGKLRVKLGGGTGGHNGLRSIDAAIGKEYWRVRLGIGHPGDKERVSGYVLGDFSKADREWLEEFIVAVSGDVHYLIAGNPELYMTRVAQALKKDKGKEETENGV